MIRLERFIENIPVSFLGISFLSKITLLLIIELEELNVALTARKARLLLLKHEVQTQERISGAMPII